MTALRTLRRGATALAMTIAIAGTAVAQEKITLRISTPAVPGDWHTEGLYIFKEWLERSAQNQFDVQVFPNATLFKQGTEPTAMQRGNLDMALISMQDISKQIPEYSIFTAGYLIRDPDHQQKVFGGEIGEEVFGRVMDKMGIKILQVMYLGTRQLNLRDVRDVKTPADLDGVKLRMPGSDTWQFLGQALGASPTPLAFPEVYLALQTGTIDGQDNPLPTDKNAKFYEVTNQIVLTSHLVDAVFLSMAGETWGKLSEAQQEAVMSAAEAAASFNNENRIRDEAGLLAFFEGEGMTITTPDVDAFREAVQAAYLASDFSKDWPEGLLDRINAVQ